MKEIQGKIKFGVIELFLDNSAFKDKPHGGIHSSGKVLYFDDSAWDNYNLLSELTEEQCVELVDESQRNKKELDFYYSSSEINPIGPYKMALISLLKNNDLWDVGMTMAQSMRNAALFDEQCVSKRRGDMQERWEINKEALSSGSEIHFQEYKEPPKLPDDFLIIKL